MKTLITNIGQIVSGDIARPLLDDDCILEWAKKHGMTVTIHTGGPSIAGSNPIGADNPLNWRMEQLELLAGEVLPRVARS